MRRRRLPPHVERAAAALCSFGAAAILSSVAAAQTRDARPGGATTVTDTGPTAFGRALANLDPRRWQGIRTGKRRFLQPWSHRGPWADAVSCAQCHFHDGRGPRTDEADTGLSHLLRLGRPSVGEDPVYGVQLRRSGNGAPAPGQFAIAWEEIRGRYPSGEPYSLRRPVVTVRDLAYGPLDPQTVMSLRVPPAVFGLGLLEAVPEDDIAGLSDADDADNDDVSGRVQRVRDPATGQLALGRFGWKASQPSLAAQSAAALLQDLGVASSLASVPPGPRRIAAVDDRGTRDGDLQVLVRYLRSLAVPARRRWQERVVIEGEALFSAIGCGRCHRDQLTTGPAAEWPELANQVIHPYTDLLLHDLGAELADQVGEGVASGREWRTAPLWGLGLLATVSGPAGLLHDGRARSPEEAILWHGGEAEATTRRFAALPRDRREALLQFLESM
jgi:CxxC motif-containing protein (DUF1111 family)